MELNDKNLSLQFYKHLCDIIGSKKVVKTSRDIFTGIDIVQNTSFATWISSGSKAEGLDLKGSDYDTMNCLNFVRVYENLNNVQSDPYKLQIIMDTDDTKPGFTNLKIVNKFANELHPIHDCCEIVRDDKYISSKLFREKDLPGHMIIHGPCQSTPGGEVDRATCFRCKEWITPARQWIYRSRTKWPHYTLITSAVQYGVLFVPIGCKTSPNEDLQWRISFSVTEKLLIYSFTHTQLLCYALMKIILNDLFKPKHTDLLCSFFLKTIMFWLSEEINPSEWKPENMISCFLDCFRRLIYCVEYKTCLHYFIPENNLFEERFTDKEHKALLDSLRFIFESPWTSAFETSTFQKYRIESVCSNGMVLSASALSCYSYMSLISLNSIYSTIRRLVNVRVDRELCTYMISLSASKVLQTSHPCNMMARNKLFYNQYKKTYWYSKLSLRSDSLSSWLMLVSLFYKCKRFLECLDIINLCFICCTPDKILKYGANSFAEQTVFNEMKRKLGLLNAFKHSVIEKICFRYPYYLLPDELVKNSIPIHPVMYAYVLQCLCCYQLGDYRGALNTIRDYELKKK